MKRNRRLWLSSGLLILILLAGFPGRRLWENNRRPDQKPSRDLAATASSTLDKADSSARDGVARTQKSVREKSSPETPGRSYGTLQREAARIFGEAEAARTIKLGERFADGIGSYLYKTNPPSPGEIETVKAQIADLRKETDNLRGKLMKGGLTRFTAKRGWLASESGKTLDRFEHLMIWEPETD